MKGFIRGLLSLGILLFFTGVQLYATGNSGFQTHIRYLASDSLKGRSTGTPEELLAAKYISEQFAAHGIGKVPGYATYLQEFSFTNGKVLGKANALGAKKFTGVLHQDFYPLSYSGNGSVEAKGIYVGYGVEVKDGINSYKNKEVKGKIVLIRTGIPADVNPHTESGRFADLKEKAAFAERKGAIGVIFFNPDTAIENPRLMLDIPVKELGIPVLFMTNPKKAKALSGKTIRMQTELNRVTGTGHNVLGFIDHQAPQTIVIGAHYDHLGLGDDRHSRFRGAPAIHNGADDNASGVAMMLELGEYLSGSGLKNNNYLLVAFSGEELGLWGSKWLAEHLPIPQDQINYMLNFDMVGRLDSASRNLMINGVGTSGAWANVLRKINQQKLNIKTTESGVGPSDHTSFYLKNIPVLHFFSGNHEDYHKPSDDEFKINYSGMEDIYLLVRQMLEQLDREGKIGFVKTKDQDNENAPRFTVTLGVVPDYTYEGEGMRIDAVTEGKAASKAGMLPGDVVLQLGSVKVSDMMSYMKALAMFRKGDTCKVKFRRGKEEMEKTLVF